MIEILRYIIKLAIDSFNTIFAMKIRLSDSLVVNLGTLVLSFCFICFLAGLLISCFGGKE